LKQRNNNSSSTSKQQRHPPKIVAAAATSPTVLSIVAIVIGWLVIVGSTIRSLPQIIRILKNKSVKGLSLTSFISELIAYTITVRYNLTHNYPFSTYGDTAICWVQNVGIVGLIFWFNKELSSGTKITASAGFALFFAWLFSGAVGLSWLSVLQASSVAILGFGGRLPQILLNYKRGNSGELSITSTGLSVAGNLSRVFTTVVLVKDPVILAAAGSQLILNSILLWQTIDTARQAALVAEPA
jgi:mannose-P-dolichol utilization defect protein 1